MVVFHKLAIYTLKLMAKPVISQIQKRHTKFSGKIDNVPAKFFIWIGKMNFRVNTFLNRKIMNIKTDSEMFDQPVNPEVALAKGVEIFWAGFLYSFLIVVSLLEYQKYQRDAQLKSELEKQEKEQMKMQIEEMRVEIIKLQTEQVKIEEKFSKEINVLQENIGCVKEKQFIH